LIQQIELSTELTRLERDEMLVTVDRIRPIMMLGGCFEYDLKERNDGTLRAVSVRKKFLASVIGPPALDWLIKS
jgi:hypothetical protein